MDSLHDIDVGNVACKCTRSCGAIFDNYSTVYTGNV